MKSPSGIGDRGPVAILNRAVDVILDVELAEHNVEEGAPDGEVGVANTQSHRDMSLDVDQLRRRGCDGDRCGDAKWVAIVRAGARRHGLEEQRMKERRRSGSGLESDGEWYHERECEATQLN